MALYAFDGTWHRRQTSAEYSTRSNVVKFARAYRDDKAVFQKDGKKMHVVENDDGYIDGVGARHGRLGWFFGGFFGAGGKTRINEALARVERRRAAGDDIVDVVGFSRGGALAVHFVNELADRNVPVRFLGLWDVVGAFGIPLSIGAFEFQKVNIGWKLGLPSNVEYCFHALSLDERRQGFRVTRLEGAYEVYFRGVHSDVGGGNDNEKLSNIALAWMLRKAEAVGLPVDPTVADKLEMNADADVKPEKDLIVDPFREVLPVWLHHTIKVRDHKDCRPIPPGCPVETPEMEKTRKRFEG